jgi:hypothetical protein
MDGMGSTICPIYGSAKFYGPQRWGWVGGRLVCFQKPISPVVVVVVALYYSKKRKTKKTRCIMIHIVRSSLRKSTVFAGPF